MPAHGDEVLDSAALQGQTKRTLGQYQTGFILQIHGGYEDVSAYLQAQARRFRVLFIDRNPRTDAERDSLRACRRYWQPLANATLHASQLEDDHRVFWDAIENLGYPLKKRSTFVWSPWPPAAAPPAPAA